MGVRAMQLSDREAVLRMRKLLWQDDDGIDESDETVLVWEEDGWLAGFITYSLRPWAEGCVGRPVPYIEGWFVEEHLRGRGIGRALVAAVEARVRAEGFHELASDADIRDGTSMAAHRHLGFEPTVRLELFRKKLGLPEGAIATTLEPHRGSREELLPLFAQADDSPAAIQSYIDRGEVLIMRRGQRIIGHVQLISDVEKWEIRSIAVMEAEQGRGVGGALIKAALERAFSSGANRVLVATATADIGNLRFYQRLGFRMERIERDAFTVETGYPPVEEEGIPIRDRVWFSMEAGDRG